MKKYIVLFVLILLAAGCRKETPGMAVQDGGAAQRSLTFKADLLAAGGTATKTTLGSDWSVSWAEGDEVSILWKGGRSVSAAAIEGSKVSFSAIVDDAADYYAVYPSSVSASVLADGSLSVQVPSVQDGTFAGCAVIVSHTTREALDFGRFRSAVAMVRFTLEDPSATRVRFSSPDGNGVCGAVTTDASLNSFSAEPAGSAIDLPVEGAGTYYFALLPGLDLPGLKFQVGTEASWKGTAQSGIPVSLSAGDLLCVKTAIDNHIEVEGNFYISVEGSGSKDGSSSANAGDAGFLRTLLSSPSSGSLLDGRKVFIAAGKYDLAIEDKSLRLSYDTSTHVTLQGEAGTVFTTSLSGAEGCILTVADNNVCLSVKGIAFTGASHEGSGGAVCLTAGSHSFNDCSFYDNEVTSTTSDRTGGAVYVGGNATADFTRCSFERNKIAVTGGGALGFHAPGTCRILDCKFVQNGDKNVGNGGAIIQKHSDNTLFIAGCSFDSNACNTNGSDIFSSKGTALMLYNCTGVNPENKVAGNLGFVRANSPVFLGNCTYSQPVVGEANGCVAFGVSGEEKNRIINNLVVCNEGNSFSSAFTSSNTSLTRDAASLGYNVLTKAPNIVWKGDGVSADLSGISYSALFSAEPALSGDGVLVWDGPAAKLSGFKTASAAEMEAAIKGYAGCGTEFYKWLTDNGAFAVDGAGNPRGTDGWWPGAYQGQ